MKILKINLLVILKIIITCNLYSQTPYFYYYNNQKQYLELNTSYFFVSVSDTTQMIEFDEVAHHPFRLDIPSKTNAATNYKRFWSRLNLEDDLSVDAYLITLSKIKNSGDDIIVAPYFKNTEFSRIGLSNFFYVKLQSLKDTVLLKQEMEKEKAIVLFQNQYLPLWFVVSVTEESRFNALEAANYFQESELFHCAEPDLMLEIEIEDAYKMEPNIDNSNNDDCANDTYFENQWGLKNTGLYGGVSGIDIKACEAWRISTGSNVKVAVFDSGIELDHPDLVENIDLLSYDAQFDCTPQSFKGHHATRCAGIIGAVRNN
jgi:subtilisin family serine protease